MRARWASAYASLTPARLERFMLIHIRKCEIEKPSLPQPCLCPALTATRGEPIIGLITRSDWPLEWRIISSTTGRLRHLRITARLCELALSSKPNFADLPLLLNLIATLARSLPGVIVKYEQYELKAWRDLAHGFIKVSSDEDEEVRINAARKLLTIRNFNSLYGTLEENLEGISG